MIYDQIANIERYQGLQKGIDVLIDWLKEHDYKALPTGRTDILGDKVFANVQEPTTRNPEEARFESHRRYMDLQVDVDGREAFRVAQGPVTGRTEFDEANDYDLEDAERYVQGDLDDDRFVVYMVGEPHMPNVAFPGDGPRTIKKICFKVIENEFFDEE